MHKILFIISFLFINIAWADMAAVVGAVEDVNSTRENLVKSVPAKPTPESFKNACKPVGMKAKGFVKKHGWKFRQVSHKNRNPKNTPDKDEKKAINHFKDNPDMISFWQDFGAHKTYYRRITVRPACLACHGDQVARPDFIKKKYKHDKAFGFKAGQLRGIYAVTIKK